METERKEKFEGPKATTFGAVDNFFRENFNTLLSPEEEWRFHNTVDALCLCLQDDMVDYDLRGAFKDEGLFDNNLPDKYRKPNHPLFDVTSIYNGQPDLYNGGVYQGGEWGTNDEGMRTFKPSAEMIKTTHPAGWMKAWMRQHEPEVILIVPEQKPVDE